MSLPRTMRALRVSSLAPDYGGCSIDEVPTPEPGAGQVLVRIRAAAIGFPDLLMTRGEYQHKPPLPFVPGGDMAGDVVALGAGVDSVAEGDSVVATYLGGGFGEYALYPAAALRPKPAKLDYAAASAFGAAYLTAYVALHRRAQLQPAEWVLVHGAAGGVGLAAVDLAKVLGARVIAASASDEKLAIIQRDYAPDAVVNSAPGFRERVKEITGGRGADIIYDPVNGDVFEESTRCIAFDGRLLIVGFTAGRIASFSSNMPLIKGFSIIGVRAGEYGRRHPERGAENMAAIWGLAEAGRLSPRVHATYPLERWREAFDVMASRRVVGRAVITP